MRVPTRGILAATIVAGVVMFGAAADAQQSAVALPPVFIEEETIRDAPGSVHTVGSIDVPDVFVGQVCEVTVIGANNDSVHPGSNIILTGGTTEVVIPDVEAVAGQVIRGTATVTVAATVIGVEVQLGPDGVFSGAATTVQATCPNPPPPPPTTAPPTTVTNPPTTTTAAPECVDDPDTETNECVTLPHTGVEPWLALGGVLLVSLGAGILIGKGMRKLGRGDV